MVSHRSPYEQSVTEAFDRALGLNRKQAPRARGMAQELWPDESSQEDKWDAEVSLIAPLTPSTTASTPTPPGVMTTRPRSVGGNHHRARAVAALPTRPYSVCGTAEESASDGEDAPAEPDPRRPSGGRGLQQAALRKPQLPSLTSARGSPTEEARPHTSMAAPSSARPTVQSRPQANALPQVGSQIGSDVAGNNVLSYKDPALASLARRLTKALLLWHQRQPVRFVAPANWPTFLKEIDAVPSGVLSFDGFIAAVQKLGNPAPRYELRVFWRRLDPLGAGHVHLDVLTRAMYCIELAHWPDLSQQEIEHCVRTLNASADKWYRAGGNWFKIFSHVDANSNGALSFEELTKCVRGTIPGLHLTSAQISDRELQGLWKALDDEGEGEVPVHRFMSFMRKTGTACGLNMHAVTKYSRKKRGLEPSAHTQLGPPPERSHEQLRPVAAAIHRALQAYYFSRNNLRAHQDTPEDVWASKLPGVSGCWSRFLREADSDGVGKVTLSGWLETTKSKLGTMLLETAGTTKGQDSSSKPVAEEDLRALFHLCGSDSNTYPIKTMLLALYRLEVEAWPAPSEAIVRSVVTEMGRAMEHRMKASGNWYKVFGMATQEGAGHLTFENLRGIVRDQWHGLGISTSKVKEDEVKAFWKALDPHGLGNVSVSDFIVFMRRNGSHVSMHRLTDYSKQKRGIKDAQAQDMTQEVADAPKLSVEELLEVSSGVISAVNSWLWKKGPVDSAKGLWRLFLEHIPTARSGKVSCQEFLESLDEILQSQGSAPIQRRELLAFWRELDTQGIGFAAASNFDGALYKLQVSTWPKMDETTIRSSVGVLNAAAEKWHRAGGNWYKVFNSVDDQGSGSMDFAEFTSVVRKRFPGLGVNAQQLSDSDLKGLWRALDRRFAGIVELHEFMCFMRHHGGSMHRLTQYSMAQRGASHAPWTLGAVPERSRDDLRTTARKLDAALAAYWVRKGVRVRSTDLWEQFFVEAETRSKGRIHFQELLKTISTKLQRSGGQSPKGQGDLQATAPWSVQSAADSVSEMTVDGAVIPGVSYDDFKALWALVDQALSGIVSTTDWQIGIYQLYIEVWPDADHQWLVSIVDKIASFGEKRWPSGCNWFKVFRLVDTDNCGSIAFAEFADVLRRPLPCLAIPAEIVSNRDLQALWKAIDTARSGRISSSEFMLFMKRLEVKRGRKKPVAASLSQFQRAKASQDHNAQSVAVMELSSAQRQQLTNNLKGQTPEVFEECYQRWGLAWDGHVSEWHWHQIVREMLLIPEEDLCDDAVYSAWAMIDVTGQGQVPADALLTFKC